MSDRYSGVWTPDMGEGDSDDVRKSLPPSTFFSKQFDDYRRKQERLSAQAWMRGYEPLIEWEVWSENTPDETLVLVIEFPMTPHFVGCFEPAHEYGRLIVWCFGCRVRDCSACKWAATMYRAELKKLTKQDGDSDELPF